MVAETTRRAWTRGSLMAAAVGAALAITALGSLQACHTDLGVGERLFACSSQADCAEGFTCAPHPGHPEYTVCLPVETADGGSGEPDGGGATCSTNAEFQEALGGPCVAVGCVDGLCGAPVKLDAQPCDDGDPCTQDDTCHDGVCEGTAYECTSPLSCRTAACDGKGGCDYGVAEGTCLIAGVCYDDGVANPDNVCETCEPTKDQTAWQPALDGTPCEADQDGCTVGDGCASGTCVAGGPADCADELDCTLDQCTSESATTFTCTHDVLPGRCLIEGICRDAQARNPDNSCLGCVPGNTKTAWTTLADGEACTVDEDGCTLDTCAAGKCVGGPAPDCGDGLDCTDDTCTSTGPMSYDCGATLSAGSCLIAGACYAEGAVNPANTCEGCAPATATDAWTTRADGSACDTDHDGCTLDTCAGGSCQSGGPADCADELSCTTDTCVSTGDNTYECAHAPDDCVIDGVCRAAGEANPDNPCQRCDPTQAAAAWSPAADDTPCVADADGCTADVCQGGVCTVGPTRTCDDGLECTDDACQSDAADAFSCTHTPNGAGCYAAEACFQVGGTHPTDGCQICTDAGGTWGPKDDGSLCDADGDGCTVGDFCAAGACQAGPGPQDCDDGLACTADTCQSTGVDSYTCAYTPQADTCAIDGACYATDERDPNNDCRACAPTTDPTAWTPLPSGTECGAGGFCGGGSCVTAPMVTIPAGSFWMGCSASDSDCLANESPLHEVTTAAYRMDTTEVTIDQYQACVDAGGCQPATFAGAFEGCHYGEAGRGGDPAACVQWAEAGVLCTWLGKRLCTEAEWEKAARGGCEVLGAACGTADPLYPWGDSPPTCLLANYLNCSGDTLAANGSGSGQSPYGLMGMAGNVFEWVEDCPHDAYLPGSPTAPGPPTDGSAWTDACTDDGARMIRGGGFKSVASKLRVSGRESLSALSASETLGFRCCMDAP